MNMAKTAAELDREIAECLASRISIDMPMSEIRQRLNDLGIRIIGLRAVKLRPIAKLFGKRGPSPEQLATYKEEARTWNHAYRRATKAYKEGVEISNAKLRNAS